MKNLKELYCRCTALIVWCLGAAFLLKIWLPKIKPSFQSLGTYIQFTVMFFDVPFMSWRFFP